MFLSDYCSSQLSAHNKGLHVENGHLMIEVTILSPILPYSSSQTPSLKTLDLGLLASPRPPALLLAVLSTHATARKADTVGACRIQQ